MNEWISRYSLLPWLDRECHTLRSEDLQAAQKARVDGTHDWCVHRLHGRSGYGLLNIYRSMVEFLIVHLLIIELLSVILNFWHHFFSYLSIHSHTRPVHAAKLRSPRCVFHCGGRLVRPDRAWIGVGWVIWKDRNAHWLEMFLSGKSGNVIINRGSSDAYSLKLTNKLNPDCGYDLQTRMNQCIFY